MQFEIVQSGLAEDVPFQLDDMGQPHGRQGSRFLLRTMVYIRVQLDSEGAATPSILVFLIFRDRLDLPQRVTLALRYPCMQDYITYMTYHDSSAAHLPQQVCCNEFGHFCIDGHYRAR